MKQHMALSSQFTSVHQKALSEWEPGSSSTAAPRMPLDPQERLLSLQIALKLADLGSTFEGHEV